MIYVPHDLHHAVKRRAVDEGRPASDLFAEAARGYLASRGQPSAAAPTPAAASTAVPGVTLGHLAEALDKQGQQIEELLRKIGEPRRVRPNDASAGSAGTKAAVAMKALLGILRQAGTGGVESNDVSRALRSAGVRTGTAETAKAVLRDAGIIRYGVRRWYLDGV